jgi:hypothetical protein
LFARCGIGREAVDAEVAKLAIHELPSARGCTYIVPASDFGLALKVGEAFGPEAEMKVARKLGVTDAEIDKLCTAVLDALKRGPLDPDALRDTTGGASRSLGEEGKKKGLTTTLPLALGRLQTEGEIRRIPTNGRLDQQRYRYALWKQNPLKGYKLSLEEAYTEMARRYFTWIGPASLAEFQWFTALSVKACKAAMEPLKLESVGEGWMLPNQRSGFESFRVPKDPQYSLVSSIDGMFLLRRDVNGLTVEQDREKVAAGGALKDLPSHAILDRGRLVGLWEYDPGTESIVWISFIPKNAVLKEAVLNMEEYVRTQLGDVRSFSLDSPKSRAPRIEAMRSQAVTR